MPRNANAKHVIQMQSSTNVKLDFVNTQDIRGFKNLKDREEKNRFLKLPLPMAGS